MRVLVQRVSSAQVEVNSKVVGKIGKGVLLLVGIEREDALPDLEWMANKINNLRIFSDKDGKMNHNIKDVSGSILSVSQFTLCANMSKGNRPGFDKAAPPERARDHWIRFNQLLRKFTIPVEEGVFGTDMKVQLINDGPVTLWLDSAKNK